MSNRNGGGAGEPGQAPFQPGNGQPAGQALIELRRVSKSYQTAAGTFLALKEVDLQVRAGEFVAIVGKSGSGKTTLINLITGIDGPSQGEVFVAGTPIHALGEGQLAAWRGENVGIVFQFFQLLPTLSALENVMLPMGLTRRRSWAERYRRALQLLEQVDLADKASQLPSRLSGGQQQRAAIARALANDPPILATDEPTGNLDTRSAEAVMRLFKELSGQGKTILMVTHDLDLASQAGRIVALANGEILPDFTVERAPLRR